MKSELETLSARPRALQDGAQEESARRAAFRIDMSSFGAELSHQTSLDTRQP
jgi:hypothetical protein